MTAKPLAAPPTPPGCRRLALGTALSLLPQRVSSPRTGPGGWTYQRTRLIRGAPGGAQERRLPIGSPSAPLSSNAAARLA